MSQKLSTFSEHIGCIVESKGQREATGQINLMDDGKLMYIGVFETFSDSFTLNFGIDLLKEPFLTGPIFQNRLFIGVHSTEDSIGFLMSQESFKKFAKWLEQEINKA